MISKWSIRKELLILLLYYSSMIFQACCDCDPALPFFDYSAITIQNDNVVPSGDFFEIKISRDSIQFLAGSECIRQKSGGIIEGAFACSCDKNGELQKYEILAINVYPDIVFSPTIPFGESISGMFELATNNFISTPTNEYEFVSLDEVNGLKQFQTTGEILIRTKSTPVSNKEYRFTIEIVKENGSIVSTISTPVIWN